MGCADDIQVLGDFFGHVYGVFGMCVSIYGILRHVAFCLFTLCIVLKHYLFTVYDTNRLDNSLQGKCV